MVAADRRVRMSAPAKMNLHLEVLRRRHDGYHEIETILQAVDLCDQVQVTVSEPRRGGEPEIELLVRPARLGARGRDQPVLAGGGLFCHERG